MGGGGTLVTLDLVSGVLNASGTDYHNSQYSVLYFTSLQIFSLVLGINDYHEVSTLHAQLQTLFLEARLITFVQTFHFGKIKHFSPVGFSSPVNCNNDSQLDYTKIVYSKRRRPAFSSRCQISSPVNCNWHNSKRHSLW